MPCGCCPRYIQQILFVSHFPCNITFMCSIMLIVHTHFCPEWEKWPEWKMGRLGWMDGGSVRVISHDFADPFFNSAAYGPTPLPLLTFLLSPFFPLGWLNCARGESWKQCNVFEKVSIWISLLKRKKERDEESEFVELLVRMKRKSKVRIKANLVYYGGKKESQDKLH